MAVPALGLLHMNCGVSCHNKTGGPGSESGMFTKLLASQLYPSDGGTAQVSDLDTYTTTVNVVGKLNLGMYKRIAPGDSAHSLVTLLSLARAPDAGVFKPMPPIVSHRPDTDPNTGFPVVEAWINALPP